MKKIILTITFLFMALPLYSQTIKIDANVKLNQQAMEKDNLLFVPKGYRISSRLNNNINMQLLYNANTGDILTTQLMRDWEYSGKIVAPEGSIVKGQITKISALNQLQIEFDTIIRPDNAEIKIVSKPIIINIGDYILNMAVVPMGTEFTIQINNNIFTTPYKN